MDMTLQNSVLVSKSNNSSFDSRNSSTPPVYRFIVTCAVFIVVKTADLTGRRIEHEGVAISLFRFGSNPNDLDGFTKSFDVCQFVPFLQDLSML